MVAIARRVRGLGAALALSALLPASAAAVDGDIVLEQTKVALAGQLGFQDEFGSAIASLGNLNGTGGPEIAVGAHKDDDGASDAGAVYVLFLDVEGALLSTQKVSASGVLPLLANDRFGRALAFLGDMDEDGLPELAVGAPFASGGGIASGVVWIVELNPTTGAAVGALRIGSGENGFPTGVLDASDQFGLSLANAGDWDGDGLPELVVGAGADDDGGTNRGAVYVLYLNANGTVREHDKISATAGGFGAALVNNAEFGGAVTGVDDQDGDGQTDLAVGAIYQGTSGSVYLLFLDPGCGAATPVCTVKPGPTGYLQIAHGVGGFGVQALPPWRFGRSLAWLPAATPYANDRLAVGDVDYGNFFGSVWLFEMAAGQLVSEKRIASQENWNVTLDGQDVLGSALSSLGDLNGDTATDLAIGAAFDDDVANDAGAVYLARLSPCAAIISRPKVYHDPFDVGRDPCVPVPLPSSPVLHLYIESGGVASGTPANACTGAPADGHEMCAWDVRLAIEPPLSLQGFTPALSGLRTSDIVQLPQELRINWIGPATPQNGKVKIGDVMLGGAAGTVAVAADSAAVGADLQLQAVAERPIAMPEPGTAGLFAGIALLAVLARQRARAGALGIALALLLGGFAPDSARAVTSISGQVRISYGTSGLYLYPGAFGLGQSLAPLGDLDGDGTLDLAAGCCHGLSGWPGHLGTMFLAEQGTVLGNQVAAGITNFGNFAWSLALLPDRNGDGVQDLVAGVPGVHQVVTLYLDRAGREVAPRAVIADGIGGLPSGTLAAGVKFGSALAALGDVDGNGTLELAVGASNSDSTFMGGSVWLLSLDAANQVVAYRQIGLPTLGESCGFHACSFGYALASVNDLDGDGYRDLVVGAPGGPNGIFTGQLFVLFLEPDGSGGVQVKSHQRIMPGQAGLTLGVGVSGLKLGLSLAWFGDLEGGGGVLAVGVSGLPSLTGVAGSVYMLHLQSDGTVGAGYRIAADESVGAAISATNDQGFGVAVAAPGDLDGDEVGDLAVGANSAGASASGAVFVFFLKDADHDGLDDVLDNCKDVHNPQQEDQDGDKVGDLCDNCVDLANTSQADSDTPDDGEGDVCEPVEVRLQTTGTPASPSWDLSLQCGAYSVTNLNGAIVLPAGATTPKLLSLSGTSVGSSLISGPGLATPAGVRSDAIYFQASGNGSPDNRLCSALQAPISLGTLTTGPISGTQLAAAALSAEGVGIPGFGLALAKIAGNVTVPQNRIRLVNGIPLPILDLELGPAVQTASGTRWEVCVPRASEEFHRVAFGLIAPQGTSTSQMRWVGCNTAPNGNGQRSCPGGAGFAPGANPLQSWTVGPSASPPGTLLPHTLYVVLEGARFSSGLLPTLNFPGQAVCLGAVELDSSPDLEPALTTDGVNDLDDYFAPGNPIVPFEQVLFGAADPMQVKLIGHFDPADDLDADGIQDLGDLCPFAYDPAQTNRGSFLDPTDESDAFGDACQCAESTNDGAVLAPGDFDQIRDYLAGRVTNPVIAQEIEERCSVAGTTECNIRDLVYLKLALDASATSVDTRCDAALSPAQGP